MRLAFALAGTDRGRSGIGRYVREVLPRISRTLAVRGDTVVAFGSAADAEAYRAELGEAEIFLLPEQLDGPAASALFHLAAGGEVARHLRADALLLPAANRRLVARSSVPSVGVVHDLAQLHVRKKYDPSRQAYLRHVVLRALARIDQIVTVSDATRRDVDAAVPHPKAPIRVVHNGVDHRRFTPREAGDPDVARARRAAGLDRPYVLYASRLEHPGKNHVRLVRAFARSPLRHTHILALAGQDWGAEALVREEIERRALGESVRLLGFVPDEHLPGLVGGSDAVAMVGLHEGFGLPALEALSAGRPVLVSATGALPEVVGDLGVICDPLDERSIEAALTRAVLDETVRERARALGPAWAALHGWETTASGLVSACEEVLS